MDFVKEFAIFLYEKDAIKFGDFKLSSGKESSFYIDLRVVPSFPIQFRRMVKNLQGLISDKVGLDNFDCIASVPTSGLVIASALAIETVKPLVYVRQKPKEYGTESLIEGKMPAGSRVVLVDDVGTTGSSLLTAIQSLKRAKMDVVAAFVVVNRNEGATELVESENVKLYAIANILSISSALHDSGLIDEEIFQRVKTNKRV